MRSTDSNAAEQMVARTMLLYEANVLGLSVYVRMHVRRYDVPFKDFKGMDLPEAGSY